MTVKRKPAYLAYTVIGEVTKPTTRIGPPRRTLKLTPSWSGSTRSVGDLTSSALCRVRVVG